MLLFFQKIKKTPTAKGVFKKDFFSWSKRDILYYMTYIYYISHVYKIQLNTLFKYHMIKRF